VHRRRAAAGLALGEAVAVPAEQQQHREVRLHIGDATCQPAFSQAATERTGGKKLEIATPADEPNQGSEPPKPTVNARKPQSWPSWTAPPGANSPISPNSR
jgi:hypothetical protein